MYTNKKIFFAFLVPILCIVSAPFTLRAQGLHEDVIVWKSALKEINDTEKEIHFTATIKEGWHMYDQDLPAEGPNSTEFTFYKLEGAKTVGKFIADRKAHSTFDKQFEMNLRYYDDKVTFKQKIVVTNPEKFIAEVEVRAQACNEQACLPPTAFEKQFSSKDLKLKGSLQESSTATLEEETEIIPTETAAEITTTENGVSDKIGGDLWQPVTHVLKAYGDETLSQAESSLWKIFLFGFFGGLIALVTPCVWPMIPMTVSFFLKRTKKRKKAIHDALLYGASIIIIYLTLGLTITVAYGGSKLNELATNAVFNLIFFGILVFFAVSFFGAFELVLPSRWTNKMDSKSDSTTGFLSLFFMSFTLVLVSFSCTGPIIGTLLVQAASMGELLGPAIGMFGFALALALPFSLFAIFPNMLQNLPKSGGWLNSVKVVMAFLELALSLKFLSVADLAYGWGILDRETFLALWIVIFACLGLYLLGKIRFPHDSALEKVGVGRFFMALVSLSFAVYMIPGLWGAPLKSISAFAPPLYTQDFNLYNGEVHAAYDNYEEGMANARQLGKPVLLDFSGFGCVNCREMENNVWIDSRVKQILEEKYVLISLMVDDKTPLPEVIEVEENGSVRKLRTIGDKWSYLQRSKFGANSQPFYVPVDAEGTPLSASYQRDLNINRYIEFLNKGLEEYKLRQSGKAAPITQ